MRKLVRGSVFVDYVRMIRARPDVEWASQLADADERLLERRISDHDWYPFDALERMGGAILGEVAQWDMDRVEAWGRVTLDNLDRRYGGFVTAGAPLASLRGFSEVCPELLNFPGIQVGDLVDGSGRLIIDIPADQHVQTAAYHLMVGLITRLLGRSGAGTVRHAHRYAAWAGDPLTVIDFSWQ